MKYLVGRYGYAPGDDTIQPKTYRNISLRAIGTVYGRKSQREAYMDFPHYKKRGTKRSRELQ